MGLLQGIANITTSNPGMDLRACLFLIEAIKRSLEINDLEFMHKSNQCRYLLSLQNKTDMRVVGAGPSVTHPICLTSWCPYIDKLIEIHEFACIRCLAIFSSSNRKCISLDAEYRYTNAIVDIPAGVCEVNWQA